MTTDLLAFQTLLGMSGEELYTAVSGLTGLRLEAAAPILDLAQEVLGHLSAKLDIVRGEAATLAEEHGTFIETA